MIERADRMDQGTSPSLKLQGKVHDSVQVIHECVRLAQGCFLDQDDRKNRIKKLTDIQSFDVVFNESKAGSLPHSDIKISPDKSVVEREGCFNKNICDGLTDP